MNDTIFELIRGMSINVTRGITPIGERVSLDAQPLLSHGLLPREKRDEVFHPFLESLVEKKTWVSLQPQFDAYANASCRYGPTGFCQTHLRGPHCPYSY